jgi:hypothetical protein
MRTVLMFVLSLAFLATGYAAAGENSAPAPQKVKKEREGKGSGVKGGKTEAQILGELEVTARRLTAQAARTLRPSKAAKEVKKAGGAYVATYVEVDTSNLSTEMRPAGKSGTYVGIIRYSEQVYECRGKDSKTALDAPCTETIKNHRTEMIMYDGKKWQY